MFRREDAGFPVAGANCAAWLYRPDCAPVSAATEAGAPCVVMAHGFSLSVTRGSTHMPSASQPRASRPWRSTTASSAILERYPFDHFGPFLPENIGRVTSDQIAFLATHGLATAL